MPSESVKNKAKKAITGNPLAEMKACRPERLMESGKPSSKNNAKILATSHVRDCPFSHKYDE